MITIIKHQIRLIMKRTILLLSLSLSLAAINSLAQDNENDFVVTVKTNSQSIDTAGSFSIVSQDEIKKLNANSIQNVLENSVGINITANDRSINGRKNITFRGMDPRHTAILINGKKVSNTDAHIGHSDFQYNWIPMDSIAKIEIIRGPMSSLYGSKALGGVVNIITKKPKNKFSANLDLKYSVPEGKDGIGRDISFNASKKFENFYFSFGVEKKLTDEVLNANNSNPSSLFEGVDVGNFNLELGYDIDDTQNITFSMLRGKEIREATLDFGAPNFWKHYNNYYDIDKSMYSLEYDKSTHFGGFNIKSYITKSDSHTAQFQKTHRLEDKVFSSELYVDLLENHYIVSGIEYKKEYYGSIFDAPTYSPVPGIVADSENFSGDTNTISFYAQDEINLGEKFLLTLGGRFDRHNIFGSEISPKAYLVYKLATNHRIKAGYGRGFNAPTIKEMSDDYSLENPHAGHAFQGNSNLKPEISNTYEIGYEYFDNLHSFKLTAFYNDISDLISTSATGKKSALGTPIEQYDNVSSASTSGVELEFIRQNLFISNLDLSIFYTFLHTEDKEKKRELNFRPKNKVNVNLDYKITKDLKTSLRYSYTGEQKNFRDIENAKDTLDGFSTLGFQVSANVAKNFNIRAGIDNLTNEKLADIYNYQLRDRTYYVGLSYHW